MVLKVHVIPGDADAMLKRMLNPKWEDKLANYWKASYMKDAIVSVTGGSTMANVSRAMHLLPFNVFFVPLVVVLVRMLFIKLTRFQRAWRNKQVVIIQHFMYQIM